MRAFITGTAITALLVGAASGAAAHPGSKILTTGSGERTAMTEGVSYEDVGGVHLFKGSAAPAKEKKMKAAKKAIKIKVEIAPAYRSIRRLRTQGFYSGPVYDSRRFTQGFYSGR